jgi:hypothetical protein
MSHGLGAGRDNLSAGTSQENRALLIGIALKRGHNKDKTLERSQMKDCGERRALF